MLWKISRKLNSPSQPDIKSWYFPNCINSELPFPVDTVSNSTTPGPVSDELKSLFSNLNKFVTGLTSANNDEDELEIQFQANSNSIAAITSTVKTSILS